MNNWPTHMPDPAWTMMNPPSPADHADEERVSAVRAFLRSDRNRELATFVLSALIDSNYQAPVYLFAPSDVLAGCAAVLDAAVPAARRRGLTVALRAAAVLQSDARITGFWSETDGDDLPEACYSLPNVAFHWLTGRHSVLATVPPFVEFALSQLAEGRSLSAFLRLCAECNVRSAADLQDLFALEFAPARIEFARLARLLDNPATLPRVRQSPAARQRCEDWLNEQLHAASATLTDLLRRAQLIRPPHDERLKTLERLIAACQSR